MSLEHISKNIGKYHNQSLVDELNKLRQEIVEKTGIEPISIKKQNSKYIVRVKNQYEAMELRSTKFNIRVVI